MKYEWLWDTLHDLVNWREKQVFETAKCKMFWRTYVHVLVEYVIIGEEIDSSTGIYRMLPAVSFDCKDKTLVLGVKHYVIFSFSKHWTIMCKLIWRDINH